MLELTPGEVLAGEVLECLNNRNIVILLKGSHILAESWPELKPGDRIVLKIVKLKPKIVFSLLFRKNSRPEAIEVKA